MKIKYHFKGDLNLDNNLVYNGEFIQDMPEYVFGNFTCSFLNLTTLKGSPKYIDGNFTCFSNNLYSLEDGPKIVTGIYNCSNNKLTNLKGIAIKMRSLMCYDNQLSNLEDVPLEIYRKNKLSIYADFNKYDLSEEMEFIESRAYYSEYWIDLYNFMISKNKDLSNVYYWPKHIIDYAKEEHKNLLNSHNSINKFKI